MKTERRKISGLHPWEKNPRTISKENFERLKRQIKELGEYKPLVITPDGTVIGGNMRLKAYQELGYKECWVSVVDAKIEEEKLKYALSDNDHLGEYQEDELANLVGSLPDFDTSLFTVHLGKSDPLDDLAQPEVVEDEPPEVDMDNEEPASRRGEVYQLGNHRLMCGDATKIEDVEKLMDEKRGNLIFTDPPYSVNYKPSVEVYPSQEKYAHGGKIFNDNLKEEGALGFYVDVLNNLYAVTERNAPLYWWHATRKFHINLAALETSGWQYLQTIIWVKERFVLSMGQDYHGVYEPVLLAKKRGEKHYGNKRLSGLKDVFSLSVDDFAELADVWYEHRDTTIDYVHPTQKPVRLAERALKRSSRKGDIVIDLFGGSGSTLIACEQLDRICYMMELDPHYCDMIRKRYAKFIGKEEEWQEVTPKV